MLDFITLPLTGATAAIIGAAITAVTAIGGAIGAGSAKRKARAQERAARARRMTIEANRQDVPDFQQDLANPYANLQVATQAAEMQAEQQDIALATTLDTLRATGASAGGATALARAAAQSKRGVAASIEQQEARNAQLRAQGEMQAAQIRQRGQAMAFQAQEAREMTQLDRQASLESSYNQQAAAYGAQSRGMAVQAVGSIASAGLHAYDAGMFKGKTPTTDFSKSVNLEGINKLDYEFKGDNLMTKPGVGAMSNASIAPVNIPDTSTLSLGGVSNPFSSLAGHYTDPNLNNFGSYNMQSLNSLVTGQVLPGGNPYLSPSLMYKIG